MKTQNIALLAGLGLGGYFVYKYLQGQGQALVSAPTSAPVVQATAQVSSTPAAQAPVARRPVSDPTNLSAEEWAQVATVQQIMGTPIETLQQERAPFEDLPTVVQQYIRLMNNQKFSEAFALKRAAYADGRLDIADYQGIDVRLSIANAIYRDMK